MIQDANLKSHHDLHKEEFSFKNPGEEVMKLVVNSFKAGYKGQDEL